ncbi:Low-density lipoprotein (LDL) receptor class A repeat-containing protein [Strongyloides ratti]|uniref:Low-density lipoprotein (LDL) receptor class A repeat-containing protein n=1 Tax=Strongyloides ratti TaxID=34506 RepID=A0A090N0A2_STRRB|nr:Low-density lipoprotein (LDL) receptor class A repeat-containing protein [Strongyloides ratti]CEF70330.1 Low-density lipoprotein (LDL) receptor class A repeat-containing protein [Strongyloides ratti]
MIAKIIRSEILLKATFLVLMLISPLSAYTISDYLRGGKRTVDGDKPIQCPPYMPFQCTSGECVPIKYLCDGSPDCTDSYDENQKMCTAASRPPAEETLSFLDALLHAHGKDFLTKIFGERCLNRCEGLGGLEKVAIGLTEQPTYLNFGMEQNMTEEEVENIGDTLLDIIRGDSGKLSINEIEDLRFFVQKLHETGFF